MNLEQLIYLVSQKPSIWDKRKKSHGSRQVVDKCWKEISEEMKVDENLIRKKWRYLRDQFCVELGKVQATGTESKWPNYEMLTFLRDTVTPRTTPSILRRQGIIPYSIEDWADTSSESDNISLKTKSVSQSTRKNLDSLRNKMRDSVVPEVAEMVAVTNQERFVVEEENEHLYFFKSLLPHVRSIPRSKLLSFRSRIQSVVEEFAYGGSSSFVECVSSNDSPMYHPEGPDPIYKPDD